MWGFGVDSSTTRYQDLTYEEMEARRLYVSLGTNQQEAFQKFQRTLEITNGELQVKPMFKYLLTINPPETEGLSGVPGSVEAKLYAERYEKDWQLFFKTTQKEFFKKNYQYIHWAFEQRGKVGGKPMGTGYHVHCYLEFLPNVDSAIFKLIDTMKKNFSKIGCNVTNFNLFNLKKITKDNGANSYVDGIKKADSKKPSHEMDVLWRQAIGIEPSYEKGSRILLDPVPSLQIAQ